MMKIQKAEVAVSFDGAGNDYAKLKSLARELATIRAELRTLRYREAEVKHDLFQALIDQKAFDLLSINYSKIDRL